MNDKPKNEITEEKETKNKDKGWFDNLKQGAASLASQSGKLARNAGEKLKDFADDGSDFVKKKSEDIIVQVQQAKNELDRKLINPVFLEDLYDEDIHLPTIIRFFEEDKKMNNEVCNGAIGFVDSIGNLKVLNIQTTRAAEVVEADIPSGKLLFIPFVTEGLYYNDPYLNNRYVNLDGYFNYIKKAKIAELEHIAQELGAKHFKVNMLEERKFFASAKGKKGIKIGGKNGPSAEASATADFSTMQRLEMAGENFFEGKDQPQRPNLVIYKGNIEIENLVDMCMNTENKMVSKKYILDYLSSTEFSLDLAKKIDAAIEFYKFNANASVSSEIEREKRLKFEYIIEF